MHKIHKNDSKLWIGRPMANIKAFILSPNTLELLPIGSIGELFIGGEQIGCGYLNQIEKTKERFIDTKWGRLYRIR